MHTSQTLFMTGASIFGAIVVSAATMANAAGPRPLILTEVAGSARIQQGLPCENRVDLTTPIVRGYMHMTWLPAARGEVLIDLTRLTMSLAPFHVEASCNGVRAA